MIAWLRKVGVWLPVGLGALLLVVFGLWRHATRIVAETKRALADSEAREKAARDSATRQAELAGKNETIETTLATEVKAIEVKHDAALAIAADEKRAAVDAAIDGDADETVALAHKMRAEGKIR